MADKANGGVERSSESGDFGEPAAGWKQVAPTMKMPKGRESGAGKGPAGRSPAVKGTGKGRDC